VLPVVQALYFEDSVQKIDRMAAMLSSSAPDFKELDQLVHQFKGSSASLGAATMAQLCIRMREGCQAQDQHACAALLGQVRDAYLQVSVVSWGKGSFRRESSKGAGPAHALRMRLTHVRPKGTHSSFPPCCTPS
jgi:HPt (histidine-containing phosphotransfer) domain-containing protein